ncbi:hypothetical protein CBR_g38121 [Chara braunii]|uniref:Cytoplasmic dynein 2 heavy chain 1 n=1 Tax=Chara braunii TaxID=69332 RepID=A0A388LP88_CHABU|nr:hypothetical protein CBR_g38121 [Chara braunii]|eukprot:GBG84147.1 hypothetical protein CBR_g38121 [Chara braunii]
MDPTHPEYEMRCQSNPAFFTKCSIQWLESWSAEGMVEVPRKMLRDIFLETAAEKMPSPGEEAPSPREEEDTTQLAKPQARVLGAVNISGGPRLVEEGEGGLVGDMVKFIGEKMVAIHHSMSAHGRTQTTPQQFVAFVEAYKQIFGAKKAEKLLHKQHLQAGLDKLTGAANKVDELSREAAEQRTLLAEKQSQAEQALKKITASMQRASMRRTEVEQLKNLLREEELQLQSRKQSIEAELNEIWPLVEQARKSVGQIKNDNLNEIRSLKMPPEAIRDVLEGVLRLMGNYDTSWMSMKKFLGSRTVKEEIMTFDARKISPELRKDVQKLMASKAASFEHANIYHVSVAAAPLAAWVRANVRYSLVLEKIRPLEEGLRDLEGSLARSREKLFDCENDLTSLDDAVTSLREEFSSRTGEAEALKASLRVASDKLDAASTLVDKLGSERVRWQSQVVVLGRELDELPISALLAAAFVTYLPSEPEDFRRAMINIWQIAVPQPSGSNSVLALSSPSGRVAASTLTKHTTLGCTSPFPSEALMGTSVTSSCSSSPSIAASASGAHSSSGSTTTSRGGFDFKRFMSSESEMVAWRSEGLPSDDLTMENAIVLLATTRVPLIIDPSMAAARWLLRHLRRQRAGMGGMVVVNLQDPRFSTNIELAVKFGKTLVLLEADRIEPVLYPLLRRDLDRRGPRWTVQIGEKIVDYNDNFRLYLVTRDPTPDIPPSASALVVRTDFTITRSGLEGQLLGLTLQHEQPELESQKSALLKVFVRLVFLSVCFVFSHALLIDRYFTAHLPPPLCICFLCIQSSNYVRACASNRPLFHCASASTFLSLFSLHSNYVSFWQTEEDLRVQLAGLEKKLLEELATSEGNILDNRSLILSLNEAKAKSTAIHASLENSVQLQASLDKQRNAYRPLAERGSTLYFLLLDLVVLNPMYRFSLSLFLRLFKRSLEAVDAPFSPTGDTASHSTLAASLSQSMGSNSHRSGDGDKEERQAGTATSAGSAAAVSVTGSTTTVGSRISRLMVTLLRIVFSHVSQSLFKSDRLTFGMHLANSLQLCGEITQRQIDLFLGQYVLTTADDNTQTSSGSNSGIRSRLSISSASALANLPSWVREDRALAYASLRTALPGLVHAVDLISSAGSTRSAAWTSWASNPACEQYFPEHVLLHSTTFERLLLIQCLRPDRLETAMHQYVCTSLGVPSVSPIPFGLSRIYADSACVGLLSSPGGGASPMGTTSPQQNTMMMMMMPPKHSNAAVTSTLTPSASSPAAGAPTTASTSSSSSLSSSSSSSSMSLSSSHFAAASHSSTSPSKTTSLVPSRTMTGDITNQQPSTTSAPSSSSNPDTRMAVEPILFITSTGADPSQELEEFALRTLHSSSSGSHSSSPGSPYRYCQLAMGQGQADDALTLLRECAANGDWLCLKNLHLMVGWLPELKRELQELQRPHPNFRLWLTSESHPRFPPSLLEACLKVAYEAPPGVKKNLQRTYSEAWPVEYIESGSPLRAQLLFLLAWFHAVVQERRCFIPLGWRKFHEFSFPDLRAGAGILDASTSDGKIPTWAHIHGLLEDAIYGGRVDNKEDRLVLHAYIQQTFCTKIVGNMHKGEGVRRRADSNRSTSSSRSSMAAATGTIPPHPLPGTRNVFVPFGNDHSEFMQLIDSLPDYDSPPLFGLPPNIHHTVQRANSSRVIASLRTMLLSKESTSARGIDRRTLSRHLSPLVALWERLAPSSFGRFTAASHATCLSSDTPTDPYITKSVTGYSTSQSLTASRRQNTTGSSFTSSSSSSSSSTDPRAPDLAPAFIAAARAAPSLSGASLPPIASFVAMEMAQGHRMATAINATLGGIARVLRSSGQGTSIEPMLASVPSLKSQIQTLLSGRVPEEWDSLWEGGPVDSEPALFLRAVSARLSALESWETLARSGQLLSHPIDLSHTFRPQAFINALRHQTAQQLHVSMDELKLASTWDPSKLSSFSRRSHQGQEGYHDPTIRGSGSLPPHVRATGSGGGPSAAPGLSGSSNSHSFNPDYREDQAFLDQPVVFITGLWIQGASFDGTTLEETRSDAPSSVAVPTCYLAWIHENEAFPYQQNLSVPVYETVDRVRIVTEVQLPCRQEEQHRWILAGVALFLGECVV